MLNFTVAQHFFSSVPAEKSPRRRRGYQTLFYTPGLSEAVIRAIEDRAQYSAAQGEIVKRQFYCLPQNLVAVAQIVPLEERDEFGRRGRYLAHTLVFNQQNLQKLNGCPLDILTQTRFATTLAEVYQMAHTKNQEVPSMTLSITSEWQRLADQAMQQWPTSVLGQLGQLTWQVDSLLKEHEYVALIGGASEQWKTLALLFALAPPAIRPALSFDTYATDCTWAPDVAFWLQGYPNDLGVRTAYRIDAAAYKLSASPPPHSNSLFANWMIQVALPNRPNLQRLELEQKWVYALQGLLTGGDKVNLPIPPDFIARFASHNREAITQCWITHLPEKLSKNFRSTLMQDVNQNPSAYLQILLDGIEVAAVQDMVFNTLVRLQQTPSRSDQKTLKKWLNQHPHTGLVSLLALWEQNSKAWRKALSTLSATDYRWLIQTMLSWKQWPFPLWDAYIAPHEKEWGRLIAPRLQAEMWKKALPELTQAGDTILYILAEEFPRFPDTSRAAITDWVEKSKFSSLPIAKALGVAKQNKKRRFGLFR